jgi:hypothetical protein
MNIFISWSGPRSNEMAVLLRNWLPLIFSDLNFFISMEIPKGANFLEVILKELTESSLGIFLLTKGNVNSQWVQFEAGAFASKGIHSKICPVWLDEDIDRDETGPLRFYQGTLVNEKDVYQLLESINNARNKPIEPDVLRRTFNSNKEEFFYNWELIKNIPTIDFMGNKTNRELLDFIYKTIKRSRITIDKISKDSSVLVKELGEKLGLNTEGAGSQSGSTVDARDWGHCTFSDNVTKVEGMALLNGNFLNGGHFTSNEAWDIAIKKKSYEYMPLKE